MSIESEFLCHEANKLKALLAAENEFNSENIYSR
jgi:hypothetical protein